MNNLRLSAYGTYKIADMNRRVPMGVVNILAPAMYVLLKEIEWGGHEERCPLCWQVNHYHLGICKLHLVLHTIESWDQGKFSLSWSDFERLRDIVREVEGDE